MMRLHTFTLLAALGMTLGSAACGTRAEPPAQPAPSSAGQADAMAEMEELFWARLDSARTRFTEADVHFMSGMIGHHAQAIVMARMVPERSRNPQIATLAARIISAQQDEIVIMEQWLRERGQPVPEIHIEGTSLTIHGDDHGEHMPGMLSPAQMDSLAAASGADFDRSFLRYMIEHHRGAVVMVEELFSTDGAGQDPTVFRFASDVQVDQRTEIARMERMLAEMAGDGDAR